MSVGRFLALALAVLALAGVAWLAVGGSDAERAAVASPERAGSAPAPTQDEVLAEPPEEERPAAAAAATQESAPERHAVSAPAPSGLRVRVLDAGGAPVAGVPVALRVRGEQGVRDFVRATTEEPDGVATFTEAQVVDLARRAPVLAALAFPLVPPVEEPVDLERARLVVLELPPTGALEVRIDGGQGPFDVVVNGAVPGGPEAAALADPHALGHTAHAHERVARFEHVGLGLVLEVLATGPNRQLARERVDGPRTAGETVVVELELPAREEPGAWPTIVGRAVDEAGAPRRGELRWNVQVTRDEDGVSVGVSSEAFADGEGRFELDLEWLGSLAPAAPARFDVSLASDLAEGRAEAHFDGSAAVVDLGDVAIEALPFLVAGRVVDDRGEPVADVMLHVESESTAESPVHTTTDTGGAFRIGGRSEGDTCTLLARPAASRSVTRVPFVPGTQDLRVVLPRHGTIAGSLVLDEGIGLRDLQIEVSRDGDGEGERVVVAPAGGRGFRLSGLAPGLVDVSFRLRCDTAPLATVAGVLVQPGELTRDARLEGLDLQRGAKRIRIDVVDADGNAIARPKTTVPVGVQTFESRANPAFLPTTRALDVTVSADGHAPVHLVGVDGDRKVVLR